MSASSRASIPARRRVAYVSSCTPRIILITRKHAQNRTASAPHFATLIQSSGVYASHGRSHGEDSSACMEMKSPMDCVPMSTARTASGWEANPRRRATRGDWST